MNDAENKEPKEDSGAVPAGDWKVFGKSGGNHRKPVGGKVPRAG